MNTRPLAVFVYGTLQRGHCRQACWPHPPRQVQPATARGRLFDLGAYPALVPGDELVLGELWHFGPEQIDATLDALDRIEGYDAGPLALYTRQVVVCYDRAGGSCRAHAYLYARHEDLRHAARIRPNADGLCVWTARGPADA
jgi:gamma-glutamylcyclotransferase (GGCT)/AIG2-like uncharacterized protein YtfP